MAALDRTIGLEGFFDLRRSWRRCIRAGRGWWTARTLQRRLVVPAGYTVVTSNGTAMIAQIAQTYVAHEEMSKNLSAVAQALDDHGIDFALCPIASAQKYRVVVDEIDRPRTWAAIRTNAPSVSTYVRLSESARSRPLSTYGLQLPSNGAQSNQWCYFETMTDGAEAVIGPEHACEIEFWTRAPVDSGCGDDGHDLHAPSANVVGMSMPPEAREPETVKVGSLELSSWQPFAQTFTSAEQRFPVDVVYTWVDDTDPNWIARRDACCGIELTASADGTATDRFTNRDELRYSLRTLESFADFVRHVYIVTDQQRPSWLIESDRLTVVDHRDIFGTDAGLPTFNSHAIESRLHHIEGLSEHYIYMNDDVFFGRRVTAGLFFEPSGVSKFFPSTAQIPPGPATRNEPSVSSAAKNGRDLLFGSHKFAPTQKIKHTPHAQRRSILFEIEKLYSETLEKLQQHRFRTPEDISLASSLYHHYGYITGRSEPGNIQYQYVNLAAENLPDRLEDLSSGRWDTFCLNDAVVPPSQQESVNRLIADWLPRAFPFPSRFERSTA